MDAKDRGVEGIFGWPWTRGGGGGSPKLTFFVDVIYVWSQTAQPLNMCNLQSLYHTVITSVVFNGFAGETRENCDMPKAFVLGVC